MCVCCLAKVPLVGACAHICVCEQLRGGLICTYGNAFSHRIAFSVVARWNKRVLRSREGKHIKKKKKGKMLREGEEFGGDEKEEEDEDKGSQRRKVSMAETKTGKMTCAVISII